MLRVYYNENDLRAVAWLKQLMMEDLIPEGDIDERSIVDVRGSDLAGYAQCHFFAGIGGWAYALRLAGWGDRPVWTASCPCQPWSQAGKGKGEQDERHLWPALRSLIAVCAPPTIIGEQVSSKAGRGWLSGVRADLEAMAYVVGATDLCSASVRSPNIRQRLYWGAIRLGNAESGGLGIIGDATYARGSGYPYGADEVNGLADADAAGCEGRGIYPREYADQLAAWEASPIGRLGNPESIGRRGRSDDSDGGRWKCPPRSTGETGTRYWSALDPAGSVGISLAEINRRNAAGFWDDFDIVYCTDEAARRIEPTPVEMVDGVPARVVRCGDPGAPFDESTETYSRWPTVIGAEARSMRLRGYGNAINPVLAAEFVMAFLEAEEML